MKRLVITATVVAAMLATSSAFAKDVDGTIKSIDTKADMITLNNGQRVRLPEGIEAETLKVGEHVAITYTTNASGKTIVSGIRPIK